MGLGLCRQQSKELSPGPKNNWMRRTGPQSLLKYSQTTKQINNSSHSKANKRISGPRKHQRPANTHYCFLSGPCTDRTSTESRTNRVNEAESSTQPLDVGYPTDDEGRWHTPCSKDLFEADSVHESSIFRSASYDRLQQLLLSSDSHVEGTGIPPQRFRLC
ncbi:hypothetical protein GIB67_016191 [Kingdonia uniflora]|uniref:Uncharacterized protein n=1 Tax=Kingdonia uniflora TaxID=39325 RepID=A0A7J7LT84_9MAGN|nr:hypothetical protein GIB67_016191 [Kingdonia uniflora]